MLTAAQTLDLAGATCTVLLAVATIVAYTVKRRRSGASHDARIASTGSSAVISQGGMELFYWNMNVIARRLAALGVTANAITWTALVVGLGGGVAFGAGLPGIAALLVTISGICDLLDGLVARAQGTSSDAGEAFDLAVDRYMEEAVFAGIAFGFRDRPVLLALALAAGAGAGMVTLGSAKAEALRVQVRGALMRRHDRVGIVVAGGALSAFAVPLLLRLGVDVAWAVSPLVLVVALVAVLGNWAAVRRFVGIARAVRQRERETAAVS